MPLHSWFLLESCLYMAEVPLSGVELDARSLSQAHGKPGKVEKLKGQGLREGRSLGSRLGLEAVPGVALEESLRPWWSWAHIP